jgi:hypothetical protein
MTPTREAASVGEPKTSPADAPGAGAGGNGHRLEPHALGPVTRADKSSVILWRNGPSVAMGELDTAAYVYLRGVAYAQGKQIGPTEYEIVFHDPNQLVEQLVVEFTNSECARYADAIRRLKKVILKPPRRERGYRF